jgi:hypothetical protein
MKLAGIAKVLIKEMCLTYVSNIIRVTLGCILRELFCAGSVDQNSNFG